MLRDTPYPTQHPSLDSHLRRRCSGEPSIMVGGATDTLVVLHKIARSWGGPVGSRGSVPARFGCEPATAQLAAKLVPPRCAAGSPPSSHSSSRGSGRLTNRAHEGSTQCPPPISSSLTVSRHRDPAIGHRPAHHHRRRGPTPGPARLPDLVRLRRDLLAEPPRTVRQLPPPALRPVLSPPAEPHGHPVGPRPGHHDRHPWQRLEELGHHHPLRPAHPLRHRPLGHRRPHPPHGLDSPRCRPPPASVPSA